MTSNPFPIASGYGNFPNGVFSPDVFAKEALRYFRQISIVDEITNSDYIGEIANFGDTVHIRTQPQMAIRPYARGTNLEMENIVDQEFTLKIDKGNYFYFGLDAVQMKQSDIDYESEAAESAAYQLKDAYDKDILSFIQTSVLAGNVEGASSSEKTVGYGAGNNFTPLDAVSRLNRILDEKNVPSSGRWFVGNPAFYESLSREVGKLIDVQVTGDSKSLIRDKGMLDQSIHGFTMFSTNNLPTNANSKPVLLAGHVGAVATATQLLSNEVLQNPNDFGMLYRGLHVYGKGVLRPSALAAMHINIGDVS